MAQWLLNNPHRLTFTMKPDQTMEAAQRAAEDAVLAQARLRRPAHAGGCRYGRVS